MEPAPSESSLEDILIWRQGDIYFSLVPSVPPDAARLPHCILAEGEATGHAHRIDEPGVAELLESPEGRYLRVLADRAAVVHQEHAPIFLPRGAYRLWRQREYTPQGIRRVAD